MKRISLVFVVVLVFVLFLVSFNGVSAGSIVIGESLGVNSYGIVLDEDDNLYVTNQSSDNVTKITQEGVSSDFAETGSGPHAITIDQDGNLYVLNQWGEDVSKITPGGVSSILGAAGFGNEIAVDSSGNVYTSNGASGTISKITQAGVSSTFASPGGIIFGVIVGNDGNIYATKTNTGEIYKITPGGSASVLASSTGANPRGLIMDGNNDIYTVNFLSNSVTKITPGGVATSFASTGANPNDLVIDSDGNLYTINLTSNNISKITPSGDMSVFSTVDPNTYTLALDSDDNIYTIGYNDTGVLKHFQPLHDPTISSEVYEVNNVMGDLTITLNFGDLVSKEDFLADLIKGADGQTWDDSNIQDIIANGDTLLVTAEDGTTQLTYEILIEGTPNIYWYKSGVDDNWNTLTGNWWTDSDHTIQAEDLPSALDTVQILGNVGPIIDLDESFTVPSTIYSGETGVTLTSQENNGGFSGIIGKAIFRGNIDFGETLEGDGYFYDSSCNSSSRTIDGDAYFYDSSCNNGTVTGNATFYGEDSSEETGGNDVGGNLIRYYTESLITERDFTGWEEIVADGEGVVVDISNATYDGSITLTELNGGVFDKIPTPNIFWYKTGINSQWNTLTGNWWQDEAHTIPATGLPDEEDAVKTLGTIAPIINIDTWYSAKYIDATATGVNFIGTSEMRTNMSGDATFNDSVVNYAEITGDVVFYNDTRNNGNIIGNVTFYDNSIFDNGSASGDAEFFDNSSLSEQGEVEGMATFNDYSSNLSASTVKGDAIFNDESYNEGPVLGNAIFNDESYNDETGTISGNAIFNDFSVNSGEVVGYACFRDESYNEGDVGGLLCPITVVTSSASSSRTSSTLNGEITDDGGGDITERGFEYGITTSYGYSTGEEGEHAPGAYVLQATDLSCNTIYHFRAYAISDFGTGYGIDNAFETSACGGSGGGGSGSPKAKTNITPTSSTTCLPGEKYNTQTGQPCTTFTSNPSTPTTCILTMTLRQGMRGEQVKCLQTKLNITPDGIFGPMTKSSVISFQKLKSLVPDGVVGVRTRGEMK